MPERWKLRLIRHFWRPNYFEELLKDWKKTQILMQLLLMQIKKDFTK